MTEGNQQVRQHPLWPAFEEWFVINNGHPNAVEPDNAWWGCFLEGAKARDVEIVKEFAKMREGPKE